MTFRERKYTRNLAAAGFPESKKAKAEIARNSGYADGYGAVKHMESNERIRTVIQNEMDRQGLQLKNLVKKHKVLLNCKHPFRPKQPDNTVQFNALKEAYKLQDVYPASRVEIDKREVSFRHTYTDMHKRASAITGVPYIEAEVVNEEQGGPPVEPL